MLTHVYTCIDRTYRYMYIQRVLFTFVGILLIMYMYIHIGNLYVHCMLVHVHVYMYFYIVCYNRFAVLSGVRTTLVSSVAARTGLSTSGIFSRGRERRSVS